MLITACKKSHKEVPRSTCRLCVSLLYIYDTYESTTYLACRATSAVMHRSAAAKTCSDYKSHTALDTHSPNPLKQPLAFAMCLI